jgi:alcohol dehydrogenase
MRAVVCTRYGPPEVLQLEELETPAPRKNELRIRVGATAVSGMGHGRTSSGFA